MRAWAAPLPEPGERPLVLVDARDVPPFPRELLRDGRPHAAAPDDDHLHGLRLLVEDAFGEGDDEHLARRVL